MEELYKICRKLHLTSDDLYTESECVAKYGEWVHIALMGYSSEMLYDAAKELEKEGN